MGVAHIQVKIKTEKSDTDTPTLPALSSITDLETQPSEASTPEVEIQPVAASQQAHSDPETESPPLAPDKKPRLIGNADIDDWLSDVAYVGGSTKSPTEMIHDEIGRYIGCEISDEEKALTILDWWGKISTYILDYLYWQRNI